MRPKTNPSSHPLKTDLAELLITSLIEGKNDLSYSIPANYLSEPNMEFELLDEVLVAMTVIKSGDKLVVTGQVNFHAKIDCAFCGEKFIKEFSEPFQTEYIKSTVAVPKLKGKNVLLSSDEIDRTYFQGDAIDFLPLIHDVIILAIPLAPRCQEECKGICPGCGANLNYESCRCEKSSENK